MANTAANEALECVMDELGKTIGEDIDAFDAAMADILASDGVKDLLDKFFGMYAENHGVRRQAAYDAGLAAVFVIFLEQRFRQSDEVRSLHEVIPSFACPVFSSCSGKCLRISDIHNGNIRLSYREYLSFHRNFFRF